MAATPSPLPIPATSQPDQTLNPLAAALQTVARAVPNADPSVSTAVAQASGNPEDAATTAQAAQGYTDATNLANSLRQQSSVNQRAAWGQMSATQQNMLKSTGYKPPSSGGSFLGSVGHFLGHYVVHDTLNALGAPLRAVQHGERALLDISDLSQRQAGDTSGASVTQGNSLLQGLAGWGHLFTNITSPTDWARAWRETTNGEHYILPEVQQQVQRQYGDQTFQIAMKLAQGQTAAQIVAKAPQAQQQALAQQITGDPSIAKATSLLTAGHISLGRMLVTPSFIANHPKLGNVLSGTVDGVTDWYSDPVAAGAKVAKVGSAARYLVQSGEDVQRAYRSSQAVQAAFADIATHVRDGNYAQLFDRYPQLAGMVDSLRAAHPQSADEVADFFSEQSNLTALIAGKPMSLPGGVEGGVLPHLSAAGQLRLAAKGALANRIDYLADTPARLEGLQPGDVIEHPLTSTGGAVQRLQTITGRSIRHLTSLTPQGDTFNPYAENWFNKLRDVAMMSLPKARAQQLLNDYAAASTIGARRLVYVGLLKEVMAAAGVDKVPGMEEWLHTVTDPTELESVASHQSYAPGNLDQVTRDGKVYPAAILRGQMSDTWMMPNYKTLYAQSKKLAVMRATNGAINNQMADKFMGTIWKPLALARFGFALRVAGEEAFGQILRAGPLAYARARLAASAVQHEGEAFDPHQSAMAEIWGKLARHLPQAAQDRIVTPIDLVAEHVGDYTSRALANVQGRLAGAKYVAAARLAAQHGVLSPDGAFGRYVASGEERAGNFYDEFMGADGGPKARVWDHGRWTQVRLSPTGAWAGYKPTAQVFTGFWYKRLHELGNDPWARAALQTRDQPLADRVLAVAEKLKSDPQWASAERSEATRDGRLVATGDATLDEAARDHAKAIIDLADTMTSKADGTPIEGLADHLLTNRRPPTAAALDEIPEEDRPAEVSGPELLPVQTGLTGAWMHGVNAMFNVIGRQIDWISRQPMFVHNFATSVDAYQPLVRTWRAMGLPEQEVEEKLVMAATDRAIHLTTPYIHNPQLRSQFSIITRNLMPFWFAQEQFYKRWARTMSFSPQAFRQAQLISQGVYHSGFTHTDPTTGQRYFVYPGAGAVQDVLTRALGAFGYKAFLPIEANLRGQVKMASPGLERIGLPNVGPLVVIPAKIIEDVFPESKGVSDAIQGSQAASSSFTQSLVPTTVTRIWQDFTASPNNSGQFASAMMQAIQYLEATGHGIGTVAQNNVGTFNEVGSPEGKVSGQFKPGDFVTDSAGTQWVVQADGQWRRNDPAALAAYMQRVKNWTRVFMVTRTIFGFNAPASPENLFDPGHVNEDLQTLLKELPFNEAIATFMKVHPDASAYTVFQTKDQAGAPLPATTSAMQFMDANQGFFDSHKLAGAFFIPQADSTGKFDSKAYKAQLQEQLRVKRTPTEFWQEIAYSNAANTYFAAEAKKNQMLNTGANRAQIDQAWTEASQQFQKANPLFAQQLNDSGGPYNRAAILQDLHDALNDPRLPETPQTEDVRVLYNALVTYQAMTAPYGAPGQNTLSSSQRYQLETEFATQAQAFVAAHPDTLPVYQRLIQPEITAVLDTEANAQQAA